MSDPIKGVKVPKKQQADKVATSSEPELVTDTPAVEPDPEPLTADERAAAEALPPPVVLPPPAAVRRFKVAAGGRAWYRGQQIRFQTGEEFTAETWDDLAIQGFRECGVTIEELV